MIPSDPVLDAVAVLATADTVAAAVEIAVDTVETGESARLARARRLGAACAPSSSETILQFSAASAIKACSRRRAMACSIR